MLTPFAPCRFLLPSHLGNTNWYFSVCLQRVCISMRSARVINQKKKPWVRSSFPPPHLFSPLCSLPHLALLFFFYIDKKSSGWFASANSAWFCMISLFFCFPRGIRPLNYGQIRKNLWGLRDNESQNAAIRRMRRIRRKRRRGRKRIHVGSSTTVWLSFGALEQLVVLRRSEGPFVSLLLLPRAGA